MMTLLRKSKDARRCVYCFENKRKNRQNGMKRWWNVSLRVLNPSDALVHGDGGELEEDGDRA